MLFSPQDERKLNMLENSLNFRFKRIGTPGAKEIAEASAVVATKRYKLLMLVINFIVLTEFGSLTELWSLIHIMLP